jgi:hypothetical protein
MQLQRGCIERRIDRRRGHRVARASSHAAPPMIPWRAIGCVAAIAIALARDAYAPVCGRDGHVYPNEVAAHAAGVALDADGRCRERAAPNWAPCGPRFCDARTSYCEIILSDVPELPTDYTCKPLPSSCLAQSPRSCDCFAAGTRCLSFCGPMDNEGVRGFHLTCRL